MANVQTISPDHKHSHHRKSAIKLAYYNSKIKKIFHCVKGKMKFAESLGLDQLPSTYQIVECLSCCCFSS